MNGVTLNQPPIKFSGKILVIDDQEKWRNGVRGILKKTGAEVLVYDFGKPDGDEVDVQRCIDFYKSDPSIAIVFMNGDLGDGEYKHDSYSGRIYKGIKEVNSDAVIVRFSGAPEQIPDDLMCLPKDVYPIFQQAFGEFNAYFYTGAEKMEGCFGLDKSNFDNRPITLAVVKYFEWLAKQASEEN